MGLAYVLCMAYICLYYTSTYYPEATQYILLNFANSFISGCFRCFKYLGVFGYFSLCRGELLATWNAVVLLACLRVQLAVVFDSRPVTSLQELEKEEDAGESEDERDKVREQHHQTMVNAGHFVKNMKNLINLLAGLPEADKVVPVREQRPSDVLLCKCLYIASFILALSRQERRKEKDRKKEKDREKAPCVIVHLI